MSDTGLPNERTALAWQRTALSIMAGSAVVTRLTSDRIGAVALLSVLVAMPLSLWVLVESRGRYDHDAGLRLRARARGGRAPVALAVGVTAIAVTELIALLGPSGGGG